MAWIPGAAATPWPLLALWGAAFGAYLVAARESFRLSPRLVWGGAIAVRLGLLGAAPALSEDVYRYLWDGRVARNGVNPFALAPDAAGLADLRTDWWALLNHPEVPTIYPPGAQAIFLALAAIGPAVVVFKLAWIAADLLVAWLLARLGSGRGGDGREPEGALARGAGAMTGRRAAFLWLWSPLVLVEVAWSGHFEPVGIAAMLGAVALVAARPLAAGAVLGLSASIKFAPLAVLPALWRRAGTGAAALALAVPAWLYLPYARAGDRLFEGLRTYADIWAFNAGAFRWIERVPGPEDLPRWIVAAAVMAVAVEAARRGWTLGRALYWTIGAAILLSPTIHPWYLLWVLPFAALRGGTAWIAFTGTVFLAYAGRDAYLATGSWPESPWVVALIHVPVWALLAREAWGAQRLRAGGEVPDREEAGEG